MAATIVDEVLLSSILTPTSSSPPRNAHMHVFYIKREASRQRFEMQMEGNLQSLTIDKIRRYLRMQGVPDCDELHFHGVVLRSGQLCGDVQLVDGATMELIARHAPPPIYYESSAHSGAYRDGNDDDHEPTLRCTSVKYEDSSSSASSSSLDGRVVDGVVQSYTRKSKKSDGALPVVQLTVKVVNLHTGACDVKASVEPQRKWPRKPVMELGGGLHHHPDEPKKRRRRRGKYRALDVPMSPLECVECCNSMEFARTASHSSDQRRQHSRSASTSGRFLSSMHKSPTFADVPRSTEPRSFSDVLPCVRRSYPSRGSRGDDGSPTAPPSILLPSIQLYECTPHAEVHHNSRDQGHAMMHHSVSTQTALGHHQASSPVYHYATQQDVCDDDDDDDETLSIHSPLHTCRPSIHKMDRCTNTEHLHSVEQLPHRDACTPQKPRVLVERSKDLSCGSSGHLRTHVQRVSSVKMWMAALPPPMQFLAVEQPTAELANIPKDSLEVCNSRRASEAGDVVVPEAPAPKTSGKESTPTTVASSQPSTNKQTITSVESFRCAPPDQQSAAIFATLKDVEDNTRQVLHQLKIGAPTQGCFTTRVPSSSGGTPLDLPHVGDAHHDGHEDDNGSGENQTHQHEHTIPTDPNVAMELSKNLSRGSSANVDTCARRVSSATMCMSALPPPMDFSVAEQQTMELPNTSETSLEVCTSLQANSILSDPPGEFLATRSTVLFGNLPITTTEAFGSATPAEQAQTLSMVVVQLSDMHRQLRQHVMTNHEEKQQQQQREKHAPVAPSAVVLPPIVARVGGGRGSTGGTQPVAHSTCVEMRASREMIQTSPLQKPSQGLTLMEKTKTTPSTNEKKKELSQPSTRADAHAPSPSSIVSMEEFRAASPEAQAKAFCDLLERLQELSRQLRQRMQEGKIYFEGEDGRRSCLSQGASCVEAEKPASPEEVMGAEDTAVQQRALLMLSDMEHMVEEVQRHVEASSLTQEEEHSPWQPTSWPVDEPNPSPLLAREAARMDGGVQPTFISLNGFSSAVPRDAKTKMPSLVSGQMDQPETAPPVDAAGGGTTRRHREMRCHAPPRLSVSVINSILEKDFIQPQPHQHPSTLPHVDDDRHMSLPPLSLPRQAPSPLTSIIKPNNTSPDMLAESANKRRVTFTTHDPPPLPPAPGVRAEHHEEDFYFTAVMGMLGEVDASLCNAGEALQRLAKEVS